MENGRIFQYCACAQWESNVSRDQSYVGDAKRGLGLECRVVSSEPKLYPNTEATWRDHLFRAPSPAKSPTFPHLIVHLEHWVFAPPFNPYLCPRALHHSDTRCPHREKAIAYPQSLFHRNFLSLKI